MDIEVQRYLYDIQSAGELIQTFVAAQTFSSYCTDAMLRSAVERQFITMGEALNQATRPSDDRWALLRATQPTQLALLLAIGVGSYFPPVIGPVLLLGLETLDRAGIYDGDHRGLVRA